MLIVDSAYINGRIFMLETVKNKAEWTELDFA